MFWTIILYILIAIIALIFLILAALLVILLIPVVLNIDSRNRLYAINFVGGRVNFQEVEGVKGLEYVFLWKRGFLSFGQILKKLTAKEEKEKGEEKDLEEELEKLGEMDEKEKSKKEKGKKKKGIKDILKILLKEKKLIKRILKTLVRLLIDWVKSVRLTRLVGTFCLPDPYYGGLCCAILGTMVRKNFDVLPNFEGKNFLELDMFLVPAALIWKLIVALFSLPLIRIYRLYKRLEVRGER